MLFRSSEIDYSDMYVIDKTNDGNLIVSSWGEKYILDLSSIDRENSGIYFYDLDYLR